MLVRLPIEAKQRNRGKQCERQGEGVGEGEKEEREGERVMIKLHCEPSCKLSQSKGATETRGTGSATAKRDLPHNKSLL